MIVLYETADAARNAGFIQELQKFGEFRLVQWNDWTEDGLPVLVEALKDELVLYRARRPEAARFLEDLGVFLVNRAEVNRVANDKWQSFQMMQLLSVPVIPTYREAPEFPCVVKTADGYGGMEVEIVESASDIPFESGTLVFQPVVEHTADVRAYVIGNRVVGAVKRSSPDGFKANYSLGGSAEKFVLSAAQEQDVLKIARALNSDYIGVDFLLLPDGRHVFNELEDPVGARSFFKTHDDNIAELLVEHLKRIEKQRPFQPKDL